MSAGGLAQAPDATLAKRWGLANPDAGHTGPTSLERRLLGLTGLRLIVLTVFLVFTVTLYLGHLALSSFSIVVASITAAFAYALTAIYALLLRQRRWLYGLARVQLVTDQIAWTAVAYITGGPASGATSLYGLTCLTGAILLGREGGLYAAISAGVLYGGLCVGFGTGLLSVPLDQPREAYLTRVGDLGYPLFVNLLALCVVTLLASYLAERLRATDGHLEEATIRADRAERLAVLGRLAAGLAHEIRNPLGSITGSIELLRTGGTLSAEDRKLCEIVERETARLNDLVGDMLDLSRPRPPNKTTVDLAETVRELTMLASKSGRGGDVTVSYAGPERAFILCDIGQMRQVVWNLMRNAIQASAPGEDVCISITPDPGRGLLLDVHDDGPGISDEVQRRIFDAFFTTRGNGMGIGLAVVKRVLDEHGFDIEIDSREGEGATFRVRVPEPALRPPPESIAESMAESVTRRAEA